MSGAFRTISKLSTPKLNPLYVLNYQPFTDTEKEDLQNNSCAKVNFAQLDLHVYM